MDSIGGAGKTETAALFLVPAGVEHPVRAFRGPDGGFSQTAFIEGSPWAKFQDGIRAELRPVDSVGGFRDSQTLAAGAVLTQEVEVENSTGMDDVGIGDPTLVPTAVGAGVEDGGG